MTFQVLPAWLAWGLIAAAAAAAAALFAIRPRPPRRVISSLLVWHRVLGDRPARSWWDRLRWLVSLILTLLIAALVAAAVAQPTPGSARAADRVLIVLDSSWTMRARTASGRTRWADAVDAAQTLAGAWRGAHVALATTAEGLIEGPTADRALIRSAFGRLEPTGGAEGAWPELSGATTVHFVTDGAVARAIPPEVVVHSVFDPAPNVAITAFEIQPARRRATATIFIAVANHAASAQPVRIAIARAGQVLVDRTIDIASTDTYRDVIGVPSAGEPRFRAHVSAALNDLDIDDAATAWLSTAAPLRVAVVARSSPLPALLAHDPSLQVTAVDPEAYPRAEADVWIFEGWLPPNAPAEPALIVDPPPVAWLGARGPAEEQPVWTAGATHPMLEGVDTALVHVGRARSIARPALQPIALSEQGTPLVTIEDSRTARRVVFGFSLADSNLMSTPAFPILLGNAIDWLGRSASDLHRHPGPAVLPAATLRLLGPDGRALPIVRLEDRVTATLDAPGLYLVQSAGGQRVVRVTLGDMRRSNLRRSALADAPGAAPPTSPASRRPWWVGIAFVALGLVVVEWITWQRRITV